jgi:hypothetical protein
VGTKWAGDFVWERAGALSCLGAWAGLDYWTAGRLGDVGAGAARRQEGRAQPAANSTSGALRAALCLSLCVCVCVSLSLSHTRTPSLSAPLSSSSVTTATATASLRSRSANHHHHNHNHHHQQPHPECLGYQRCPPATTVTMHQTLVLRCSALVIVVPELSISTVVFGRVASSIIVITTILL